ncbi:MAG: hypothetical protein KKA51_03030 [Nanoarchaeota archaeon]|nr:hypothetical protein [Nanoarchaeota archaeon]
MKTNFKLENILSFRTFRYFIYVLLSLIPVLRVGKGYIWHTDTLYFLNPGNFFLWSQNQLGESLVNSVIIFPFKVLISTLNMIFQNNYLVSVFFYCLAFFLLMISVDYIFGKIFFDKMDNFVKGLALFALSIFSVFNPLVLEYYIFGFSLALFLIVMFLWQFYFFYKLLKTHNYKYLIYSSILNIFLFQFVVWIIFQAILLSWLVYESVLVKRLSRNLINYLIPYLIITVLLISFFLVPLASQISSSDIISSTFKGGSDESVLNSFVPFQKVLNYLTLQSYYNVADIIYFNDIIIMVFILFILFILFSTCIVKIKEHSKLKLFWLSVILISIIFATGKQTPFGFIFSFLWDKTNYFHIFRSTIRFVLPVYLAYIFLLAIGITHLVKVASKKTIKITAIILILLFLVTSWPLLTGNINGIVKANKIPTDYQHVKELLSEDMDNFNILVLPYSLYNYYTWYNTPETEKIYPLFSFENDFYKKPVIIPLIGSYYLDSDFSITNEIYRKAQFTQINLDTNVLNNLNIKYILIHNDRSLMINGSYVKHFQTEISNILQNLNGNLETKEYEYFYLIKNLDFKENKIYLSKSILPYSDYSNLIFFLNKGICADSLCAYLKIRDILPSMSQEVELINISDTLNVIKYNSSNAFSWSEFSGVPTSIFYPDWKEVVVTNGAYKDDSLSFESINDAPYIFPEFSTSAWNSFNSTVVYLKTDNNSLIIRSIMENNESVNGLVGVWWESGWIGMQTKLLNFPIEIPPNQKAIIQILNSIDNLTIEYLDFIELAKQDEHIKDSETNSDSFFNLKFEEINPTHYDVFVENASSSFVLVFGQNYDSLWEAYLDGQKISEDNHMQLNGFANGWIIDLVTLCSDTAMCDKNDDGTFNLELSLEYLPQKRFYLGLLISSFTLFLCLSYLFYDWRRRKTDPWAEQLHHWFMKFRVIRWLSK